MGDIGKSNQKKMNISETIFEDLVEHIDERNINTETKLRRGAKYKLTSKPIII